MYFFSKRTVFKNSEIVFLYPGISPLPCTKRRLSVGETLSSADVIESNLAKDIDCFESKLTRHGYKSTTLAGIMNVQRKVIRSFLNGKLQPGQIQEIQVEMLAAGIPF